MTSPTKLSTTLKRLAWQAAMLGVVYLAFKGSGGAKNLIYLVATLHWLAFFGLLVTKHRQEIPESYLPKLWGQLFSVAYIASIAYLGFLWSAAAGLLLWIAIEGNKKLPLKPADGKESA